MSTFTCNGLSIRASAVVLLCASRRFNKNDFIYRHFDPRQRNYHGLGHPQNTNAPAHHKTPIMAPATF